MASAAQAVPWYRRVRRWGQTNLTEGDARDYDGKFWQAHWKKTRVQGVIVNAGGIVAYYPSAFPLQYQAKFLGTRDLFGEIVTAARAHGLAVLARMDSNRADERFYREHPDWFAVDAAGQPYRAQERCLACVNSPYYRDYLPRVLTEIMDRYHPEGFTDNSWSGMGQDAICYCRYCAEKFQREAGRDLPGAVNWSDPGYRQWVRWGYRCRLEVWDLNNATVQTKGGPDCLWMGMVNAEPAGACRNLRDLRQIGKRSKMVMCDHQSRDQAHGFEQNGLNGKLLHGVSGWETVIPESMATYVRTERPFRVAANPAEETRVWMMEAMAGGISPWWHHIGARHEDRRQYETAEPMLRWHEAHEKFLYDREPVANVGVVWSQRSMDFYARAQGRGPAGMEMRGWGAALTRGRIPYLPVHVEQIEEYAGKLAVLVLADVGAMSEEECAAVRRFAAHGGSVIASGGTSLFDEWGDRRGDFGLADVLGVHATGGEERSAGESKSWEDSAHHTYLRLRPELNQGEDAQAERAGGAGEVNGAADAAARHALLRGLEQTDLVGFGGSLQRVAAGGGAVVLATYVPSFPIYPPEFCWMRTPRTDVPAILAREDQSGGRMVYLAADIDRCYGRGFLPDHADLMANAVRWAARGRMPLQVSGAGYLDCHLYRQGERIILHLVNLTHCRGWPMFVEEHVPAGPFDITLRLDHSPVARTGKMLVAGGEVPVEMPGDALHFRVSRVLAHEVIVIG